MKNWKIVGVIISALSSLVAAAKSAYKFIDQLIKLKKPNASSA